MFARHKGKPPEQIPRPGVEPSADVTVIGGGESVLPLDEMAFWLGGDFLAPAHDEEGGDG